jgi:recombinational DNA repair protein RecT
MSKQETTAIQLQSDFQNEFLSQVDIYLESRKSNSPEFKLAFEKVASDMIYSQTVDGLEAIKKARPLSLFNAVFVAAEIGASFAKKEISVLPFAAKITTTEGDVVTKKATGENDLTIVVDINFQKQMILKMPNCKHFFTAEVHEGVQVCHDLTTGNCEFEGKNDVTKPTIGYYSRFVDISGEVYDIFMSCNEIVERAKMNKVGFKPDNYKNTSKSVHYEKIVVRNLLKEIPRVKNELSSVLAWDEIQEITPYEDVTNEKPNALEAGKKELSESPVEVAKVEEIKPEKVETTQQAAPPATDKFF